jgi:putative PIN family toxin of toxin-antitoxin system
MRPRVVFDTSTVLSALAFPQGSLTWLRGHWANRECVPLLCKDTASEIEEVLKKSKFKLGSDEQIELLSDYVPFCEVVPKVRRCPINCRDKADQIFLDLAHSSQADVLVTSDKDLLVLAGQVSFTIESPVTYRDRV